jgi:hypothetical protein
MLKDALRAESCVREIQSLIPIFQWRNPKWIPVQQRGKDFCAMLFGELLVCAGWIDCLQIFAKHITGSADHWQALSRALVENELNGQKDWRHANSPAYWVKKTANNITRKEYWLPTYAVDPSEDKDRIELEEVAEVSDEVMLEPKYTERSLAELETAAKADRDVAEYLAAKIRYPHWRRDEIWGTLGWQAEHGERVDRRFRRLRNRLRELGAGIQCREYSRPGLSDASCTTYFEPLCDGAFGSATGVWQHRDPDRDGQ